MARWLSGGVVWLGAVLMGPGNGLAQALSPAAAVAPSPEPVALPRVHDPVVAFEGRSWVLFSTGRGIVMQTSTDGRTWVRRGRVFPEALEWAKAKVPGSTDYYWAPDISFFAGKWHLYYSVSTFGKNRSVIGLATNETLDPAAPGYRWVDEGPVIESQRSDRWNAVDPNVAFDEKGEPWLAFGSFWSGIKLRKLEAKTGRLAEDAPTLYDLATRDRDVLGAVEAPFVVRHGEAFFLFVSFDYCCRGTESTYHIRVGRAAAITGPYVDRDGRPMREGGGTLLRETAGRWHGPGHNAVVSRDGRDWMVYHAYDARSGGLSRLRVEELRWDAEGWPVLAGDGSGEENAALPVP